MPIDQRTKTQIQQMLDQLNAEIADNLDSEEYRAILTATLNSFLQGVIASAKSLESPECVLAVQCNLMDMATILRMAQTKMFEMILRDNDSQEDF